MTTETIRVIVKENDPIQLGVDEKYLYSNQFTDTSKDWAVKTDGKVVDPTTSQEVDYSAKAYAIGGTGTTTNNSKYYSEQASASATTATTQASVAEQWAIGEPSEPTGGHSAKWWAEHAQSGNPVWGHITGTITTQTDLIDKFNDYAGKVVQLGFDGTLENTIITFEHSTAYTIEANKEYELDLLFPVVGTIDDNYYMRIKNGSDYITFVNALDKDAQDAMTFGNMKQLMRYYSTTGYRWLFKGTYKITSGGNKLFLIYPVVSNDTRKANLTGANTFTGNNTFSGTNSFTGTITATTPATSSSNTTVATTAYVKAQNIIKETYTSGTSGYRIWTDGYCEQWGFVNSTTVDFEEQTVTFLKVWADTNYNVVITPRSNYGNTDAVKGRSYYDPTTTTMKVYPQTSNVTQGISWRACGYLASGQY